MATNSTKTPTTGREVILISNDGQKFYVPPSVARASKILAKKLKDSQHAKGSGSKGDKVWDRSITLKETNAKTMAQVIQWARQHKGPWAHKVNGDPVAHVTPWDEQFISGLERDDIFKLSLAAKDLQMEGLLQLTCKEIAKMISGKTPEQVRSEFGIVDDLTPEDHEQIRLENEILFGPDAGPGRIMFKEPPQVQQIENTSNTPHVHHQVKDTQTPTEKGVRVPVPQPPQQQQKEKAPNQHKEQQPSADKKHELTGDKTKKISETCQCPCCHLYRERRDRRKGKKAENHNNHTANTH